MVRDDDDVTCCDDDDDDDDDDVDDQAPSRQSCARDARKKKKRVHTCIHGYIRDMHTCIQSPDVPGQTKTTLSVSEVLRNT